ncbi:hypothetical protein BS17DRAFT_784977 [Gyrodon lividus]|nr:hypothetical protein BS17DRAFT_784977 [Gyrodon lividus]
MCVVARLMRMFVRTKFINFCGQPGARLNADQSLYAKLGAGPDPLSRFLRVLDPFFFRAPSGHMRRLEAIWIDRTINIARWKSFIAILSVEWNGFTIYSTVIPLPSPPHMIMAVVGSIIASVILSSQTRGHQSQTTEEAAWYMYQVTRTTLPYVLLMWR